MATKPTPGGSDGTYGTELNAFLDESLASDGKIKDGAVLEAATETADGDRTVVDLSYAKTGDTVQHDSEGGYSNCDVNGTKTKVYTIYFSGTLDSDSSTSVAHGLADIDKILHVSAALFSSSSNYIVTTAFETAIDASSFILSFEGTNIVISSVGTNFQGRNYRIKIDYIL